MPLAAGDELYLDYGESFWKIQQERMAEVGAWQKELQRALQVCMSPSVNCTAYHLFVK